MADTLNFKHLLQAKTWIRGAFMLLFLIVLDFAKLGVTAISLLQFLIMLLTGKPNVNLKDFSAGLNKFILQAMQFLTYQTEKKPFPFDEKWPS